jgi:hypothetical protein
MRQPEPTELKRMGDRFGRSLERRGERASFESYPVEGLSMFKNSPLEHHVIARLENINHLTVDLLDFSRSTFRHACTVWGWDPGLLPRAEGTPPPVRCSNRSRRGDSRRKSES